MAEIKFSPEELTSVVNKVQLYFQEELDREIGQFDAEFLVEFFAEEIGAFFYNRGLYDAQALFESKVEAITEAIYELEKPTTFK